MTWKATHRTLLRYGAAASTAALALLLTLLLAPLQEQSAFILFLGAVAVSTWYGGLKPGLLSLVLSALALDYFHLGPAYAWGMDSADFLRLGAFLLVAILISSLHAARERAERAVERERDELSR